MPDASIDAGIKLRPQNATVESHPVSASDLLAVAAAFEWANPWAAGPVWRTAARDGDEPVRGACHGLPRRRRRG